MWPNWHVPKPRKTKGKPRHRALPFLFVVALAALSMTAGWWHYSKRGRTQPNAAAAQTNLPAGAALTNTDDKSRFMAWLSNQTDTAELLNLGTRLLEEEGRTGQAIVCYRRALELKPEDEEVCFNLGVAHARSGQIAEAEHYYREAIKLFPEYLEAHNNLGNLLTRQKRYADAMEEFNTALKLAPENASAHNNLGRVLAEQGNATEALKHFIESARLDTNYVEARFNMGGAYLALGQTNEAAASFREALRLRPGFAPATQALTRLKNVLQ